MLRSSAGQVSATCRHDACHLNFFFYRNVQGTPPIFVKRVYFRKFTAPTRGRASTTGPRFLGNKRLGTFQITNSRLRDQTTVGSNYLLGEGGRGSNYPIR